MIDAIPFDKSADKTYYFPLVVLDKQERKRVGR